MRYLNAKRAEFRLQSAGGPVPRRVTQCTDPLGCYVIILSKREQFGHAAECDVRRKLVSSHPDMKRTWLRASCNMLASA